MCSDVSVSRQSEVEPVAGRLSHLRYALIAGGAMLVLSLTVIVLNVRIGQVGWENPAVAQQAYEWQKSTRGLVGIAYHQERRFKLPTLQDRLPEIDAVVLGSSTMMPLTAEELAPLRPYNLAASANPTSVVVAEAREIAQRMPSVKWLVVGLDYTWGQLYSSAPSPAALEDDDRVSLPKQVGDAISQPRVRTLIKTVFGWVSAQDPLRAISLSLRSAVSEPYRCADGGLGRDFAAEAPLRCQGFRRDGSMNFGAFSPLSPDAHRQLLEMMSQTEYFRAQFTEYNAPNEAYLKDLADAAALLQARGGGMLAMLPPMMPGLERRISRKPAAAAVLERTRTRLDAWGRAHGIIVIDASAPERYGCDASEFFDDTHYNSNCAMKLFERWRRGRPAPGLYVPVTASVDDLHPKPTPGVRSCAATSGPASTCLSVSN